MANKNSLLKSLTSVLLCRDMGAGGGSTTLAAAPAKGAQIISLTSATNFAVGDTVRVGSGSTLELVQLVAGQVSPLFATAEPLARAHAIGEAVVEQAAYDLGDITDSGVENTLGRESTDVNVATRRLTYALLLGYGSLEAAFTLPGISLENIAFALGMPLGSVTGSGAASTTPKHIVSDLTDISGEQNASLICFGVTFDGTPSRVELWGIDPDYTAFSVNMRRGTLAGVPARFVASAGGRVSSNAASAYVANTTYRAGKGKVFDSLQEVGYFTDGATQGGTAAVTTVTSGGAAGSTSVTLTAVTNIAVGDWLKFGSGDTSEFHRVGALPGGNVVTTATRFLRNQAAGVAVKEQTLVPFANIHPDGVTLAIGGSVDRLREATQVFNIGTRPVNARAALSFGILDFIPTALARAAGIDPATIVSNTFNLDEKLGTNITDGVYMRGVLADGSTAWVVMWGCSQDVTRAALTMASSGQPQVPTSWVPASGILMMQHT